MIEDKKVKVLVFKPQDLIYLNPKKLKPAKYNPQTMTPAQYQGLKESIQRFGFKDVILINKDHTIISGHKRVEMAIELGLTKIPCIMEDRTKPEEKEENLAMNNRGSADLKKIAVLYEEIRLEGGDFSTSGLTEIELQDISSIVTDQFKRPQFSHLVDKFERPEKGKSDKNENWFYVEFYEDDETFKKLTELLQSHIKGKHEIKGETFKEMVVKWRDGNE